MGEISLPAERIECPSCGFFLEAEEGESSVFRKWSNLYNAEMAKGLLSCPFCGKAPTFADWRDGVLKRASVRCDPCGIDFYEITNLEDKGYLDKLFQRWNTRA